MAVDRPLLQPAPAPRRPQLPDAQRTRSSTLNKTPGRAYKKWSSNGVMDSWQPQRNSNLCLNLERVGARASHRRRRLAGVRSVSRGSRSTMSLAVCTRISIPWWSASGVNVVDREHLIRCRRSRTSHQMLSFANGDMGFEEESPDGTRRARPTPSSRPGGLVQAPALPLPGPSVRSSCAYARKPTFGRGPSARASGPCTLARVEGPRSVRMSSHVPRYCLSRRTRRRSSPEGVGSFPTYLQRACYRPRASGFDRHKPGDQRSERGCLNPFPLFPRGRFEEPRLALDP